MKPNGVSSSSSKRREGEEKRGEVLSYVKGTKAAEIEKIVRAETNIDIIFFITLLLLFLSEQRNTYPSLEMESG